MTRSPTVVLTAACVVGVVAGCGSEPAGAAGAGVTGDITVFAAASLKSTFTELGAEFAVAHPGAKVVFTFAGSSDLATQISQGAPADVFASADTRNMDKVTSAGGAAGVPVTFATNVLEIVTPRGNPAGIGSFADLARPGVKVVLCAPQVPCGAAAKTVSDATGTTISPVSEESSVTDVLGKVRSGEADAGLVYATDVAGARDTVTGVPFPAARTAVNTYPVVALRGSKAPGTAAAFAAFVAGEQGRKVLSAAGFGPP